MLQGPACSAVRPHSQLLLMCNSCLRWSCAQGCLLLVCNCLRSKVLVSTHQSAHTNQLALVSICQPGDGSFTADHMHCLHFTSMRVCLSSDSKTAITAHERELREFALSGLVSQRTNRTVYQTSKPLTTRCVAQMCCQKLSYLVYSLLSS